MADDQLPDSVIVQSINGYLIVNQYGPGYKGKTEFVFDSHAQLAAHCAKYLPLDHSEECED
jgi:hypothetical protein